MSVLFNLLTSLLRERRRSRGSRSWSGPLRDTRRPRRTLKQIWKEMEKKNKLHNGLTENFFKIKRQWKFIFSLFHPSVIYQYCISIFNFCISHFKFFTLPHGSSWSIFLPNSVFPGKNKSFRGGKSNTQDDWTGLSIFFFGPWSA